jgi:ATP dependent DNA ligase domain
MKPEYGALVTTRRTPLALKCHSPIPTLTDSSRARRNVPPSLRKRRNRLLSAPKGDSKAGLPIVMVAFDLLYLNGYDLLNVPLSEHKAILKKLVAKTPNSARALRADGRQMYTHACTTLRASSPLHFRSRQ